MSEQLRPPDSVCILVPSGMLGAGFTPGATARSSSSGASCQDDCELPAAGVGGLGHFFVLAVGGRRMYPPWKHSGIPVLRSDRNAIVGRLLGEADRTR